MEKLLDILNFSIPVALMFFGSIFTLVGTGADVLKIKVISKVWRYVCLILGIPTFLVGVISATLFMYKIVFDVTIIEPNFTVLLAKLYASRIILGGILLLVFVISTTITIIREHGYKLSTSAVLNSEYGSQDANILVENIGKGKIKCVARLVRVTFSEQDKSKKRKAEDIKVDALNPDGRFLLWKGNYSCVILSENIPQVINLVTVDKNDGAKILFFREANYKPYSSPLKPGKNLLEIDLLRMKGVRQVCMCKFARTLEIESKYSGSSLVWK